MRVLLELQWLELRQYQPVGCGTVLNEALGFEDYLSGFL